MQPHFCMNATVAEKLKTLDERVAQKQREMLEMQKRRNQVSLGSSTCDDEGGFAGDFGGYYSTPDADMAEAVSDDEDEEYEDDDDDEPSAESNLAARRAKNLEGLREGLWEYGDVQPEPAPTTQRTRSHYNNKTSLRKNWDEFVKVAAGSLAITSNRSFDEVCSCSEVWQIPALTLQGMYQKRASN
jgi:hypothetical protein